MSPIVAAFTEWDHISRSLDQEIVVYTDHRNLEYFNGTKTLNCRPHRWADFLQPFNFKVVYREGCLNGKADALSGRSDYRPEGGVTRCHVHFSPSPMAYTGATRHLATTGVANLSRFSLAVNILGITQDCRREWSSILSSIEGCSERRERCRFKFRHSKPATSL